MRNSVVTVIIAAAIVLLAYKESSVSQELQRENRPTRIGNFRNAKACSTDPAGNLYVLDGGTSELLKYSPEGKELARIGGYGWNELAFDRPNDEITPNGLDIYVADYGNHRIQRFDRNLNFVSTFAAQADGEGERRFGYPISVAVSRSGSLFILDGDNKRILKLSSANSVERAFGGVDAGQGNLHAPVKIRVSRNDLVYVQDRNSLVVYDMFGNYLRRLGDSVLHNLRTFVIDDDALVVIDSCSLIVLNESGTVVYRKNTVLSDMKEQECKIVDIASSGDILYVLGEHSLIPTKKEYPSVLRNKDRTE